MSTWVVDASVLIKTLFVEAQHEIAVELWAAEHRFIAPVTAVPECANAACRCCDRRCRRREPVTAVPECANAALRKVRHEGFPLAQARAALPELMQLGIEFLPVQGFQAVSIFDVARSGGFTSHDAVYLLLAEDHDARLVTADARLLRAAAESTRWQTRVVALADWAQSGQAAQRR